MKISKLFHWLYGLVMLLPIFAILSAILVNTFNMSAKQETEITYKYETNEVNSYLDLVEGNIYKVNLDDDYIYGANGNCASIYIFNVTDDDGEPYPSVIIEDNGFIDFGFSSDQSNKKVGYDLAGYGGNNFILTTESNVYIVFTSFDYQEQGVVEALKESDYSPIESIETHNLDSQDIFYKAIEKVEKSPIFSWSYNSFLVAPFSYIVALFGMPTNHVIVELLSYWLAISIIWLVFDLIMYLPLLIHRWLDKGVLE